ncbi:MAG: maleylacetoacetate isomerase [Pseudomonadota bacterium]
MELFSYFRSSAAYRLRIALNLKGIPFEYAAVNLLRSEQSSTDYTQLNPLGLVPALRLDSGDVLTQSIAILEWLEEAYPAPALLPTGPNERAKVRAVVNIIACDVHPICNLSVTRYLATHFEAGKDDLLHWYCAWMSRGFHALQNLIGEHGGPYCFGDSPSLADVCLVPQLYNARRFDISLDAFPALRRVDAQCRQLDAFSSASPELQPDALPP